MPKDTTAVVADPPAKNTAEDALANARGYINRVAASIAADSYPQEAEAAPEEPVKPEAEKPEEPAEEPKAETGDEDQPSDEAAEPEVKAEGETAEQADEEEGADTALPPEVQESVNKRIGKEVAKTKAEKEAREAAESQLNELRAQVEELRAKAPVAYAPPEASGPFERIDDTRVLQQEKVKAQNVVLQVEDLLDRVADEPEEVAALMKQANLPVVDDSVVALKRTLRGIKQNAERAVTQLIPQREQFLNQNRAVSEQVLKQYPALADKNHPVTKLYQDFVAEFPGIKSHPAWPMVAALQATTLHNAMLAKTKAKAAAAPVKAVPPKIPAKPKSAAQAMSRSAVDESVLQKRLVDSRYTDEEARIAYLQRIVG